MKTPTFSPAASRASRDAPCPNSPTSFVRPPANENKLGNGRYSPNGTRWILSYRAVHSPDGLTNAAELDGFAGVPTDGSIPIEPAMVQVLVARDIALTASRKRGSLVKNGAGDSGQTSKSIFAIWPLATEFTLSSVSWWIVCCRYAG